VDASRLAPGGARPIMNVDRAGEGPSRRGPGIRETPRSVARSTISIPRASWPKAGVANAHPAVELCQPDAATWGVP
jgi:hypothetical protein